MRMLLSVFRRASRAYQPDCCFLCSAAMLAFPASSPIIAMLCRFYHGDGYQFTPFSFALVDASEEI